MITQVARMFQRRDPQREAAQALARITTLCDVGSLPWTSGVYEDRRVRDELATSLGVWITVIEESQPDETISLEHMRHIICCDLRANGFGVLSATPLDGSHFVLAVPNGAETEDSWKFFVVRGCHQSMCPGGWFRLGLHAERLIDPTSSQRIEFRTQWADYLANVKVD